MTTECPTCGREDFKSERGMKHHHAVKHNESLSKITKSCDVCSNSFTVYPSREEAEYCSNSCRSEGISGEGHSTYNRVKLSCKFCGSSYKLPPSEANSSNFCSDKCMHEWQSENWNGENSPSWEGGDVEITCEICGDEFYVSPNKSSQKTCSKECAGLWFSNNYSGENHPSWSGGSEGRNLGGNKWGKFGHMLKSIQSMRCEYCESIGNYSSLQIHHVEPLGMGGKPWDNEFMVLCLDCHYGNYNKWHPPQLEEYI